MPRCPSRVDCHPALWTASGQPGGTGDAAMSTVVPDYNGDTENVTNHGMAGDRVRGGGEKERRVREDSVRVR